MARAKTVQTDTLAPTLVVTLANGQRVGFRGAPNWEEPSPVPSFRTGVQGAWEWKGGRRASRAGSVPVTVAPIMRELVLRALLSGRS